MSSADNQVNTSGDTSTCLIIKAALGTEIRKVPIVNDEITFDELLIMMQRIFKGRLHASDDVTIKYRDEDGDLISIRDSSDLSFAISLSSTRILHLILLVNEIPENIGSIEFSQFRRELRKMRDFSIDMLDRIESNQSTKTGSIDLPNGDTECISEKSKETASVAPTVISKASVGNVPFKDVSLSQNSEFDPLHQQNTAHSQDHQHYEFETDAKPDLGTGHINGPTRVSDQIGYKPPTSGISYGMPPRQDSRPETPGSLDTSSRSSSQKPASEVAPPPTVTSMHQQQQAIHQQQQAAYGYQQQYNQEINNVAMIQPSHHQQINAAPLSQMSTMGSPMPPQPIGSTTSYMAPSGTVTATVPASYGTAPCGTSQQAPLSATGQHRPPVATSTPAPTGPYYGQYPPAAMPQPYQPQQQYGQQQPQHQQGSYAPPMSTAPGHYTPQPAPSSMATAASYGTGPASTPVYGAAAAQLLPQSHASAPPMGVVGPPPMGGVGAGGANPFARVSQSPYIRPATFTGGQSTQY